MLYRILILFVFIAGFSIIEMPAQNIVADDEPDMAVDSIKASLSKNKEFSDSAFQGRASIPMSEGIYEGINFENDSLFAYSLDSTYVAPTSPEWVERKIAFNPDPKRAVWMSALFPGLGQIYNRRYWKLPILVGGYLGLAYATSWNTTMLRDYTRAYADIMDNDPSTKSYMDFFPPSVKEENLDKTWLTNLLKNRKDFFRRNRDLCLICIVGVYLVAMVDAYVDASLAHFDISPDLSMDWAPAIIPDERGSLPSFGLHWAFNF